MLVDNSPTRFLTKEPLCGVVPPRCGYILTLTMPKHQQPSSLSDGDDCFTLYSMAVGEYELRDFDKDSVSAEYNNFLKKS